MLIWSDHCHRDVVMVLFGGRSEVCGDSECPSESGHVAPIVIGRLVALVEVDLLLG